MESQHQMHASYCIACYTLVLAGHHSLFIERHYLQSNDKDDTR